MLLLVPQCCSLRDNGFVPAEMFSRSSRGTPLVNLSQIRLNTR